MEIKFFMRAAIPFVVLGITLAAVGLPFTSLGFWIVLIPTAVAHRLLDETKIIVIQHLRGRHATESARPGGSG